jgi:Ca-activated chloride channel family protein
VLVVTDAEVSDAARILRLADEEAKRPGRRRISVLCIDAAPNSFLALQLAERGGGVARFLTSDPEAQDITTALDEVLADWAQPVLTSLRLELDRPDAQAAGRETWSSEEGRSVVDLADLPAGRAIWAVGRFPRDGSEALALRVLAADGREVKARRLDLAREGHDLPALKALFGARRIVGLEYLMHSGHTGGDLADQLRRLGYDPEPILAGGKGTPSKVYAENMRSDAEAALRKLLVEESLSYGLISSETAFVAVRRESGKSIEETVVVANALPAGWDEGFLGFGGGIPARVMSLTAYGAAPAAPPDADVMYLAAPMPVTGKPRFQRAARASSGVRDAFAAPPAAAPAAPDTAVLFAGVPLFAGAEAVLFDSARTGDAGKLAETATFSRLTLRYPGGDPQPDRLDRGLELLLFVGDLAQPRARVRLADLLRQGGERPLNLRRGSGQPVRIVLVDPAGAWSGGAPPLEVALG